MTRCILIDPKTQTVTVAECRTDRPEHIVAMLGCQYFEATPLPNGDHLLLDEEGLMAPYKGQGYFTLAGAHQPFVGRGLVFGEKGGELVPPQSTVPEIWAAVIFVTEDVARSKLAQRGPFF